MGDYQALRVWDLAHKLALDVYTATRAFPRDETYGLRSQMRRAAVSVPANLAEGCGRDTDPEIVRFTRISLGSASELEYYLRIASDLGYLSSDQAMGLRSTTAELKLMLAGLANALAHPRRRPTTDDRRLTTDD